MAKKIKFTSKKNPKPSKLARAGSDVQTSSIYYQGERIGSVEGNTRIILICDPKPVYLRLKEPQDHRYAVNWVKEHAHGYGTTIIFESNHNLKKENHDSTY